MYQPGLYYVGVEVSRLLSLPNPCILHSLAELQPPWGGQPFGQLGGEYVEVGVGHVNILFAFHHPITVCLLQPRPPQPAKAG